MTKFQKFQYLAQCIINNTTDFETSEMETFVCQMLYSNLYLMTKLQVTTNAPLTETELSPYFTLLFILLFEKAKNFPEFQNEIINALRKVYQGLDDTIYKKMLLSLARGLLEHFYKFAENEKIFQILSVLADAFAFKNN